ALLGFSLLRDIKKYQKQIIARVKIPACILYVVGLVYVPFSIYRSKQIDVYNFLSVCGASQCRKLSQADHVSLDIYNKIDQRYLNKDTSSLAASNIPQVLHFIWGRENPFPQESVKNIASWMKYPPSWTVKVWTDDPNRPIPIAGVEQ